MINNLDSTTTGNVEKEQPKKNYHSPKLQSLGVSHAVILANCCAGGDLGAACHNAS